MITKRPNGNYRVKVYYRGRYVTSRTFRRKAAAIDWERKALDALAAGIWADDRNSEAVTVEDWARLWLVSKKGGKPSAQADRERFVNVHVVPKFGSRPLLGVQHSEIAIWARDLAQRRSPSTARGALGALRGAFELAERDGVIQKNPVRGIALPARQAGEPRPITHSELWKLAGEMEREKDRLLVLVAGYSGLRWGELTALQPEHVLANGALRVMQAWSDVGGVLHLGDVKTHQARTVPLPRSVATDLLTWAASRPRDGYLFHASEPRYPLRNGNYRKRVLNPALKRAGIADFTPHNFRDTSASLAIQAGATVLAVSRLLGHRDATTTLKHYAALFPDDLSNVADRLEAALASEREEAALPDATN